MSPHIQLLTRSQEESSEWITASPKLKISPMIAAKAQIPPIQHLLKQATQRITTSKVISPKGTIFPSGSVYLGEGIGGLHLRMVKVDKFKGRTVDCSIFVENDEVRIRGARDSRPILEPSLGYPVQYLAAAIITCLVYPEQAALMLAARPLGLSLAEIEDRRAQQLLQWKTE